MLGERVWWILSNISEFCYHSLVKNIFQHAEYKWENNVGKQTHMRNRNFWKTTCQEKSRAIDMSYSLAQSYCSWKYSPHSPPPQQKKKSWERKCCHMTMLASSGFTQHHICNSGTVTTKGSLPTCLCHNTWSITSRNCTLLTFWFPDSRMRYVVGKYLLRAYYVTRTEWGIRTHNCIIHTLVYLISHNFYKNKKVI